VVGQHYAVRIDLASGTTSQERALCVNLISAAQLPNGALELSRWRGGRTLVRVCELEQR
jgi:hypothetical protein